MLSYKAVRVTSLVGPGIAFLVTGLRLLYRRKRHHLGWDDLWAAFSTLCLAIATCGAWLLSDEPGVGPLNEPAYLRVTGFYMVVVSVTCVTWGARLSILCSIIRIVPHMMPMRRWAQRCAVLFVIFAVAFISQKLYLCERNPSWKLQLQTACPLPQSVAIVDIITTCIADIILIYIPLRLFYGVDLPDSQRILLMAVFSSSVLITIVTVVHAAYIYVAQLRVMPVLAYIEISIAVLVCNFSVLGTWAFRSLWKNEEFTTEVNPITTFSIGITTTHQAELDANATSEIPSTALTNFSTHEGIKSTESIEKRLTSRSLLSQVSSGPPSVHTLEDNIPLH